MSGRKIDINKATIDELSTLIGVGRAKAEAIFETRKVCTQHLIIALFHNAICVICWKYFSS